MTLWKNLGAVNRKNLGTTALNDTQKYKKHCTCAAELKRYEKPTGSAVFSYCLDGNRSVFRQPDRLFFHTIRLRVSFIYVFRDLKYSAATIIIVRLLKIIIFNKLTICNDVLWVMAVIGWRWFSCFRRHSWIHYPKFHSYP